MTEDEGKASIMDQLRFDPGLGCYSVSVTPDSVWTCKGMGTYYYQIQLKVGIPQVDAVAGRGHRAIGGADPPPPPHRARCSPEALQPLLE